MLRVLKSVPQRQNVGMLTMSKQNLNLLPAITFAFVNDLNGKFNFGGTVDTSPADGVTATAQLFFQFVL